MNEEFLNFLTALINASPDLATEMMTPSIEKFIDKLKRTEIIQDVLTDNGKTILKFLQSAECKPFTAKQVAEEVFMNSRGVSGVMRKLVADGFCEKIGKDPCHYKITDKGIHFDFE